MKKALFVILLIAGPISCNPPPCGGVQQYLNITNQESIIAGLDNAGDSMFFSDLRIDTQLNTEIIALYEFKHSWTLIQFTYACSPPPPVSEQMITKIEITSSSMFDSDHQAEDDLFELFELSSDFNIYPTDTGIFPIAINDWNPILNLHLKNAPTLETGHVFTVTVYLDDGKRLVDTTREVVIL